MEIINVKLLKEHDDSYDIIIGSEIFDILASDLEKEPIAHSYAIITDSEVNKIYGNELLEKLKNKVPRIDLISFPHGEKNKDRKTKEFVEDTLLEKKFARDSCIIALGGGVVGDLAGFVAATYARGIPYIQVPTTLVACVDSSIGGKTAVDTPHGKNLIGSFFQPVAVYIDPSLLNTLDRNNVNEGLAEVIKYGVISSSELFEYLEQNLEKIFNYDEKTLLHIIKESCKIKTYVVEHDEKELNLRKILNFGHTIGHAIENLSNYKISHGKAISIGMTIEAKIADKLGILSEKERIKIENLISKAGLPAHLPTDQNIDNIIEIMKLDKKSRLSKIEMVLPSEIGRMHTHNDNYGIRVEEDLIRNVLNEF